MSAALAPAAAADGHRAIVVAALMANYMTAVNISLPNAALLYIEGTLSMADDEVGWIFTSYITASVVTMTMTRWLAGRYGRKTIYLSSVASLRSALCWRRARRPRCNSSPPALSKVAQAAPSFRCRWRSCSIFCRPRAMPA